MLPFLMRAAVVFGGCLTLVACSQPVSQSSAGVAQSADASRPRMCIGEAQPGHTALGDPWSITVSSEGGACPTTRGGTGAYDVLAPPAHGRIAQEAQAGVIVISYTPDRGYVGADGFELRDRGQKVAMPFYVGVVP
jgi:hypothetical protein